MYEEDCSLELERRFANLARSCLELDDEIHAALRTPRPDQVLLNDLKRQMLRVKGQMAAMGGDPMEFVSPFAAPDRQYRGQHASRLEPCDPAIEVVASRCTMASSSSSPQEIPVPSMTPHDCRGERAYRLISSVEGVLETARRITRAIAGRTWRGFECAPS